jgi:hypothetical protein
MAGFVPFRCMDQSALSVPSRSDLLGWPCQLVVPPSLPAQRKPTDRSSQQQLATKRASQTKIVGSSGSSRLMLMCIQAIAELQASELSRWLSDWTHSLHAKSPGDRSVFNGGPGERRSVSSLGMGLGWGQAVVASTLGDTRRGDGSFLWGLKRKKKE